MRWKGNTGEARGTRSGGHEDDTRSGGDEDDRTEVRATGSVYSVLCTLGKSL